MLFYYCNHLHYVAAQSSDGDKRGSKSRPGKADKGMVDEDYSTVTIFVAAQSYDGAKRGSKNSSVKADNG